jgi:hypothetical protein
VESGHPSKGTLKGYVRGLNEASKNRLAEEQPRPATVAACVMTPADLPPNADCPPPKWVCIIEGGKVDRLRPIGTLARSVQTNSGSTVREIVDRHTFRQDLVVSFTTDLPNNGLVPPGVGFPSSSTT